MKALPYLLGIALALSACSSTPDAHPAAFDYSRGGRTTESIHVSWEGDHLLYTHIPSRDHSSGAIQSENIQPTEAQWQAFWAEMEAINVWQWRSSYASQGKQASDSGSWNLTLSHSGRSISSGGEHAYPSDADPRNAGRGTGFTQRYIRLDHAIRSLIGKKQS